MREQVAAEQIGQRGGERRLRRDKRSGMGHSPPPFGLSLSKPRSFLPASKKDSPSTSSGRTEFMAVIKLIVRSFQRGGSSAATASRRKAALRRSADRQSVGEGKSVPVRVDHGGRRR